MHSYECPACRIVAIGPKCPGCARVLVMARAITMALDMAQAMTMAIVVALDMAMAIVQALVMAISMALDMTMTLDMTNKRVGIMSKHTELTSAIDALHDIATFVADQVKNIKELHEFRSKSVRESDPLQYACGVVYGKALAALRELGEDVGDE